ncbi:MAG: hypothetical protein IPJ69_06615 [Deltaproteobacteria bacterium]|nr:MAG: hypothetical protein IPJ69_06615 [Deltaproteobacteria bacterium]
MKINFRFVKFIFIFAFFFTTHFLFAEESSRIMGAVTCSAAACHGGTQKKKDEFSLWSTQDKHHKAYGVLFEPRSQKMAKILGLSHVAQEDDFCLGCHAVKSDVSRNSKFDLQEGVTCEVCHGASEKWLEPHTQKGWTHPQSVKLGLVDLENKQVRGETCLHCHGTIDHKLLSAGHPDVVFELDTFSAMMPKHWEDKESWAGAKAWATGQVVSLKQHLNLLETLAREGRPFDEGLKNCFACHHNIYDVKWTLNDQASGKAAWDHAHDIVFLDFLKIAFPEQYSLIQPKIQFLDQAFLSGTERPELLIAAAQEITSRLDEILPQIPGRPWGQVMIFNLIHTIILDPQASSQGYHVAEQVFMALDSLSLSAQKKVLRLVA